MKKLVVSVGASRDAALPLLSAAYEPWVVAQTAETKLVIAYHFHLFLIILGLKCIATVQMMVTATDYTLLHARTT